MPLRLSAATLASLDEKQDVRGSWPRLMPAVGCRCCHQDRRIPVGAWQAGRTGISWRSWTGCWTPARRPLAGGCARSWIGWPARMAARHWRWNKPWRMRAGPRHPRRVRHHCLARLMPRSWAYTAAGSGGTLPRTAHTHARLAASGNGCLYGAGLSNRYDRYPGSCPGVHPPRAAAARGAWAQLRPGALAAVLTAVDDPRAAAAEREAAAAAYLAKGDVVSTNLLNAGGWAALTGTAEKPAAQQGG
jgi:hypothetical protein